MDLDAFPKSLVHPVCPSIPWSPFTSLWLAGAAEGGQTSGQTVIPIMVRYRTMAGRTSALSVKQLKEK
jgi:hypothetical protein